MPTLPVLSTVRPAPASPVSTVRRVVSVYAVTPEAVTVELLSTVRLVALAIADTVNVSEPILIASPTASSVSKAVPVPVTVAEAFVVATVPVRAVPRFPLV